MKILIPVLGFSRAGGARVLAELANEWIKRGHEPVFLVPDTSQEPYFPTRAPVLWANGRGAVSGTRERKAQAPGRYHLKALYRGLRRIGALHHVILANHSLTAWPVFLAACGEARKFYYVQAYEPEFFTSRRTPKGYALAALSALSYQLPLTRIVNAPLYLRYRNLRASRMVPPGIDLEVFSPRADARDDPAGGSIVLGCIGRVEPEKGTIYALRAFEALARRHARMRLRVAYGGLAPGWSHPRCEVVVPRNDRELAEFYRSLDVLIAVPTVQQGGPHYPVLEAWACGVPVVTTGYMGASERTAWMVRNRDPSSICAAVEEVIADPAARKERIERAAALAREHAWPRIAAQMLEALKQP
jgi:glycosyltransferase involved in cell wall biosynthesis